MRQSHPAPAGSLHSISVRYRPSVHPAIGQCATSHRWPSSSATESGGTAARVTRDRRLARLEAILFLAREPLSSRKLSQYANLADGTEARTLVRRLNRLLDERGRAFRVDEIAGGFQLTTRPRFANWLRRLEHTPRPVRLSAPALETLAVVAYRQPVMRAAVEAIRGVSCGEILRQLMERELVCVSGRSDELGRPFLYSTTKRFLHVFGLNSMENLPRAEVWRGAASVDASEALPAGAVPDGSSTIGQIGQQVEEESDVSVSLEPEKLIHAFSKTSAPQDELPARDASLKDDDDLDGDDFDDDEDDDDAEDEDEKDGEFDIEEEDEDLDEDEDDDLDDDLEDDEWEEVDDEDWDDDDDWEDDDDVEEDEEDEEWD